MTLIRKDCAFFSGSPYLKCAVNPAGECRGCGHFKGESMWLPSENLITKVIGGVVLAEYQMDTGRGKYRVWKVLSICNGGRNVEKGTYTIHTWESGAPYKNDNFYGNCESLEEAALLAIQIYGIVAVDNNNRVITKKAN